MSSTPTKAGKAQAESRPNGQTEEKFDHGRRPPPIARRLTIVDMVCPTDGSNDPYANDGGKLTYKVNIVCEKTRCRRPDIIGHAHQIETILNDDFFLHWILQYRPSMTIQRYGGKDVYNLYDFLEARDTNNGFRKFVFNKNRVAIFETDKVLVQRQNKMHRRFPLTKVATQQPKTVKKMNKKVGYASILSTLAALLSPDQKKSGDSEDEGEKEELVVESPCAKDVIYSSEMSEEKRQFSDHDDDDESGAEKDDFRFKRTNCRLSVQLPWFLY